MKIHKEKLQIRTRKEFDIVDITTDVEKAMVNSGILDGYALVYSPHTTCAIVVNEKETGLLSDIDRTLGRLVPKLDRYVHDDFDVRTENLTEGEMPNAHAHIRQLLAGRVSEYIPIHDGVLGLGQWQRVMLVEFDCPRDREVLLQVCGA
ncbi:MAG: secondary thiamine-phosphate synthase enzyme YjbQ [Actinomycetota bacterium]